MLVTFSYKQTFFYYIKIFDIGEVIEIQILTFFFNFMYNKTKYK